MEYTNLKDQFLIAMDSEVSNPFDRTVVYVCEHSDKGAMGLVVNREAGLELTEVFSSMEIKLHNPTHEHDPVLTGGPVQENVGFILHQASGPWESTLNVSDKLSVTTSKDILYTIGNEAPAFESLVILGYSGWGPGQLEHELQNNFWLTCPATEEILFHTPIGQRWEAALKSLGISPLQLSTEIGHA